MTANQRIMIMHETRMWVAGVIIPLAIITVTIMNSPRVQLWMQQRKMRRKLSNPIAGNSQK
jgi:hypothetical protein